MARLSFRHTKAYRPRHSTPASRRRTPIRVVECSHLEARRPGPDPAMPHRLTPGSTDESACPTTGDAPIPRDLHITRTTTLRRGWPRPPHRGAPRRARREPRRCVCTAGKPACTPCIRGSETSKDAHCHPSITCPKPLPRQGDNSPSRAKARLGNSEKLHFETGSTLPSPARLHLLFHGILCPSGRTDAVANHPVRSS
jgi:hypothetical protein